MQLDLLLFLLWRIYLKFRVLLAGWRLDFCSKTAYKLCVTLKVCLLNLLALKSLVSLWCLAGHYGCEWNELGDWRHLLLSRGHAFLLFHFIAVTTR